MVKTRSQTGNITIKKEEQEDRKPTLLLNGVSNTRSNNKITKRTPSKNRTLPAQQVKVEEDIDIKSLLKSSSGYPKSGKKQCISQEQINQLIHYIVNDNMTVYKASRQVKISHPRASYYYNVYKNDPEKNVPSPRNRYLHPPKYYTREQVGNLIKYITQDKMTIKEASAKVNMNYHSGHYYYTRYLKDPSHAIPVQRLHHVYTQDQREVFLSYIINDKMSIKAASKKANMSLSTAKYYYRKHFKKLHPDIPTPSHIVTPRRYTQEQLNEVMGYIINDKMSIADASRKANVCHATTGRCFHQYLKDHNMKVPVAKIRKQYTQEQIKEAISYIVDGKMTIKAASEKANISKESGRRYYHQYLKDRNIDARIGKYTPEQKSELIRYIVDGKMSITAASKKANISKATGFKHYRLYLKDQKRGVPT